MYLVRDFLPCFSGHSFQPTFSARSLIIILWAVRSTTILCTVVSNINSLPWAIIIQPSRSGRTFVSSFSRDLIALPSPGTVFSTILLFVVTMAILPRVAVTMHPSLCVFTIAILPRVAVKGTLPSAVCCIECFYRKD